MLMSLSASHNYNSAKHLRALLICVFLVLAPIFLMTYLWTSFSVGTWLLAVSAFCIEVIVKVSVTVCVYMLFLYDQFYQVKLKIKKLAGREKKSWFMYFKIECLRSLCCLRNFC